MTIVGVQPSLVQICYEIVFRTEMPDRSKIPGAQDAELWIDEKMFRVSMPESNIQYRTQDLLRTIQQVPNVVPFT